MSQRYVDSQYADGCTPVTVCKCFAFDSLSATMKVAKEPAMKGKDNTNRNHAAKEFEALGAQIWKKRMIRKVDTQELFVP